MAKSTSNGTNGKGRAGQIVGVLVVVVLIGMAVVWLRVVRAGEESTSRYATASVQRGPLTISVLESGTIKAQKQEIYKSEIEGRTSILYLIEEGTRVEEGDLLVELDATTLQDSEIDQEIKVQNAEAAYINATETLAVTKNQAQSDIDQATLDLQFAEQDLNKYKEGQFPNDKTAAENEVKLAEEQLTRAEDTLVWSQKLFDEKYISETELQADRLSVTSAKNRLIVAENNLRLLLDYEYDRQIDQLESDLSQAKMALERVERKAKANIAQAEADLKAKELEYRRQQDKMKKISDQLAKAKIYAKNEGMVIYATSARRSWRGNDEPLDEGREVHEREELIYLPTTASTMAEVDIHEASLDKVRLGLPAIITVDAIPGKKFFGTVAKIAPLPDPQSMWMNPDLKVYNSEIHIQGEDPALRTGMNCKAEIIVEQHEDALYIPVQAVLRVDGKPTVYVVSNGVIEPRTVEIGLDNNVWIHVMGGLEEGEEVLLEPPLDAAVVESGSKGIEFKSSEAEKAPTEIKDRVSQQLQKTNGDTADPNSGQQGGEGDSTALKEIEALGRRMRNASGEEREKLGEQLRKKVEALSPEDRQKLQQRMQQRMGGRGPGQGQGAGQRRGPGGQGGGAGGPSRSR